MSEGKSSAPAEATPQVTVPATIATARQAVARTVRLHAALVRRIGWATPAALARKSPRSRYTTAQLILGCASHIAYHTGQIAVLRRLYGHAQQPAPPAV